ncbi:hypothetical protein OG239_42295 (plasmid) [Streptomyces sp. NBC_00868]|uniref:hypothetical protein n=1 Tax=Streptomyces sp. NBC_00868 TaxID=2903683 RepID=UPI002F90DD73|nr:hypothetical protein OG239_42295 [Streptomyces sp. NBC_00868]
MASEVWEDEGEYYCFQSAHVLDEEAWIFELSEARRAPASWAGTEHQDVVMPGVVMVAVVAHDPDVEKPPFVRFDPEQPVPFSLMKRFVERVAEMLDSLKETQPPG